MVNIAIRYAGNKKCDLKHPEGATLRSDAPKDIGGDASGFIPTDLVAAGLAACVLTTMAMWGERNGLDLTGMTGRVEKNMTAPPSPRRIRYAPVVVEIPAAKAPAEIREKLEHIGNTCPVKLTLHPEVDAPITYKYV